MVVQQDSLYYFSQTQSIYEPGCLKIVHDHLNFEQGTMEIHIDNHTKLNKIIADNVNLVCTILVNDGSR